MRFTDTTRHPLMTIVGVILVAATVEWVAEYVATTLF